MVATQPSIALTADPRIVSLPAGLRLLWSQVLFPGPAPAPSRMVWASLLMLLIVPGFLLYPGLDFRLFEPDEGRYAEIPREMIQRGEWIIPYLQGEPYLDKPPLLYWLVGLSYRLFGVHDWAARLVPAFAIHARILITFLIGRRSLGERPAFWGALLLTLAPAFVSVGRLLVLDGLLTLWVSLSLLAAFEALRTERLRWRWWLLAAAASGLGILTKGPIALVLLVPPLAAYGWLSGRLCRVSWRAGLVFVGVVLAVALPWYVGICLKLPAFAGEFFWRHNVVRFLQPFDHLEPIWYYVPILLAGLLPGSLLLWPALRFLTSSATAPHRSPALGFMVLAGGWCVLFFSLSGCKLATYILPSLPFLALALGQFLTATGRHRSRATLSVLGTAFVLLLLAHQAALPWYARFHSPFGRPADVTRCCADRTVPIVCYPRSCDSVAFYLGRDDVRTFRGKDTQLLIDYMLHRPRTVVLCTHRHSLQELRTVLPSTELYLSEELPLFDSARAGLEGWQYLLSKSPLGDGTRDGKEGLCYLAVVQRRH